MEGDLGGGSKCGLEGCLAVVWVVVWDRGLSDGSRVVWEMVWESGSGRWCESGLGGVTRLV